MKVKGNQKTSTETDNLYHMYIHTIRVTTVGTRPSTSQVFDIFSKSLPFCGHLGVIRKCLVVRVLLHCIIWITEQSKYCAVPTLSCVLLGHIFSWRVESLPFSNSPTTRNKNICFVSHCFTPHGRMVTPMGTRPSRGTVASTVLLVVLIASTVPGGLRMSATFVT